MSTGVCVWTTWSIMSQAAAAFSFKQDPVSVLTHLVVQWIFSLVSIYACICCTTSFCIRHATHSCLILQGQNTQTKTIFWINLFNIFGNIFHPTVCFSPCPLIWLNTVRYKSMSIFNYYKFWPIKKKMLKWMNWNYRLLSNRLSPPSTKLLPQWKNHHQQILNPRSHSVFFSFSLMLFLDINRTCLKLGELSKNLIHTFKSMNDFHM